MPFQFSGCMYQTPTAITKRTTPTLVATRIALVVALSRMPITKTMVDSAMMTTAGKLNQAPPSFTPNHGPSFQRLKERTPSSEKVAEESRPGTSQWKSLVKTLKYLVQSAAKVPQLIA